MLWGQARAGGPHVVTIERRSPGAKAWTALNSVKTDGRGYFRRRVARRPGSYRFRWADPGGKGVSEALRVR
jgi:hypothetical protein